MYRHNPGHYNLHVNLFFFASRFMLIWKHPWSTAASAFHRATSSRVRTSQTDPSSSLILLKQVVFYEWKKMEIQFCLYHHQSPRVSAQQEFQANTHSVNRADGTEEALVTKVPPFFANIQGRRSGEGASSNVVGLIKDSSRYGRNTPHWSLKIWNQ